MRRSLAGVKARLERLTAQRHAEGAATDWDAISAILCRARNNPQPPPEEKTAEEFSVWSAELRRSARGAAEAKQAERLIALHVRLRAASTASPTTD